MNFLREKDFSFWGIEKFSWMIFSVDKKALN